MTVTDPFFVGTVEGTDDVFATTGDFRLPHDVAAESTADLNARAAR